MSEHLIGRIIEVTKSPQSEIFYRNAIKLLGEGIVDMELGELKYQINTGNVQHPGRYFTKLLMDQLKKYGHESKVKFPKNIFKDTYHELTQQDLFRHLVPREIPKDSRVLQSQMPQPYFRGQIPFPSILGQEFFTLSTNQKKSDTISYTTRTLDGQDIEVLLIRGKLDPKEKKGRGILAVHHGKIVMALIKAWTDKGCHQLEHSDGTIVCMLRISAWEFITKYLNWKNFGTTDILYLKTCLHDLKNIPYYFQPKTEDTIFKGFHFTFIGDFRTVDLQEKNKHTSILEILFSTTLSYQLKERKVLTKSDDFINIKHDIAWKLRLHIEPRIIALSKTNEIYSRNLENLIFDLNLPKAPWHKYKSTRKQRILGAVEEINGSILPDGRIIKAKIIPNKPEKDYKLIAYLESTKQRKLSLVG